MDRHIDVCVIGGGPAGLAAAIRTRWVKTYKAIPCSTVIVEPGRLGGLTRWGPSRITGPSFRFEAGVLADTLARDVEALNIPVLRASALRVRRRGERRVVQLSDGSILTARAVVIATGLRRISNEEAFLGSDVTIPYMGYEFLEGLFRRVMTERMPRRLLVVGNRKTANLEPLLTALCDGARNPSVVYLLEPGKKHASRRLRDVDVRHGRVERFLGKDRLRAVRVVGATGPTTIRCDHAIIDYNAFELEPALSVALPPGLARAQGGFLAVDREMATSIPGIFAAGDVTGLYASAGKAVAEGIVAGLGVVRYVHEAKFGRPPVLFAYRASEGPILPGAQDLEALTPAMRPGLLARVEEAVRSLRTAKGMLPNDRIRGRKALAGLVSAMDGKASFREIARTHGVAEEALLALARRLVEEKHITVDVGNRGGRKGRRPRRRE